jgi:glycine oxidase
VALSDEELPRLWAKQRWQQEAGARVERLEAADVAALEPALAPVAGALLFPDDAQLAPRPVVEAVIEAVRRAGVRVVETEALAVRRAAPARWLLDTGQGPLETELLVLAGGSWSAQLPGVGLPTDAVLPLRGQLIELPMAPTRHTVFGGGGYLARSQRGQLVVGSTLERVGWVRGTTPSGLELLEARARRLVPASTLLSPVRAWSGFRPGSIDGLPLIGQLEPGLLMATGHFRNGILLAPLTAEIVADLASGRPAERAFGHLSPRRLLPASPGAAPPFAPSAATRPLAG